MQEEWERDRRREDREDRAKKDEELNGVRLQLRDQAATFATKDTLRSLEQQVSQQIDREVEKINSQGTEGFRQTEAERHGFQLGQEQILEATNRAADNSAQNRRWLIGIIVTVVFGVMANILTIMTLMLHIFKVI